MEKLALKNQKSIRCCICGKQKGEYEQWRIKLGVIRGAILLTLLFSAIYFWDDNLWTPVVALGAVAFAGVVINAAKGHSIYCSVRKAGLYMVYFLGSPAP